MSDPSRVHEVTPNLAKHASQGSSQLSLGEMCPQYGLGQPCYEIMVCEAKTYGSKTILGKLAGAAPRGRLVTQLKSKNLQFKFDIFKG